MEINNAIPKPIEVDTLFFGGGTPTQLTVAELSRLFAIVTSRILPAVNAEVSVEANPDGLSNEKLAVLRRSGVNRISLGLQSFDDAVLRNLERRHTADELDDCIRRVKSQFSNVSFDVIFAVPGQSMSVWHETLEQTVSFAPNHVSTYGLTYEKGTSFWSRLEKGSLERAEDLLEREMYELSMSVLENAGYAQYEISSFARPGFRCIHNQAYWTGLPYLGFGPGAAGYIDGRRSQNHRSVTTWIKRVLSGDFSPAETEEMTAEETARERLVLGLRMNDGIDSARFERETGFSPSTLAEHEFEMLEAAGQIRIVDGRIRLTQEGRLFADTVAGHLL